MLENQYQKYQQNSVLTASPQELTLMLYNGAIKFCNLSIEMINEHHIEKANYYILKVQAIIQELQVTLDSKYSISKEIRPLYDYIMSLLEQGNIKKDVSKIYEAKDLIVEFRDLWREAMKKAKIG